MGFGACPVQEKWEVKDWLHLLHVVYTAVTLSKGLYGSHLVL